MAIVAVLGRKAGVMRPTRNVLILLFVLLGLVAVIIGAYAGRTTTHKAAAPGQTSPAPAAAPAAKRVGESATAPTATSADSQPAWPPGPRITAETNPAAYLVAVRTGRHTTFDRVVFEFRGRVPGYAIQDVERVTQDASGRPVPLRGRAFLHVVFRHASEMEQLPVSSPPYRMTYTGPSTITPGLGSLLQVKAAGDFEGHLGFGIGLAERVGFRVLSLTKSVAGRDRCRAGAVAGVSRDLGRPHLGAGLAGPGRGGRRAPTLADQPD
jgi:hypothetical protein